jgi:hypothetical protein
MARALLSPDVVPGRHLPVTVNEAVIEDMDQAQVVCGSPVAIPTDHDLA